MIPSFVGESRANLPLSDISRAVALVRPTRQVARKRARQDPLSNLTALTQVRHRYAEASYF